MEIVCEFNLCIYNDENKCILDKISLGNFGDCESAIVPDFPSADLKRYKAELLRVYKGVRKVISD